MRHPNEGDLRRLLDEPAGVAAPDREHAADCAQCQGDLLTMHEDRGLVHAALAPDTLADVDVDAAWRALTAALDAPGPARPAPLPRPHRLRPGARRRLVAAVAATAVLAGTSAAAASGWLPIFRTEQVAPVGISAEDLNALPDLSAFGDYEVSGEPDIRRVADAAAAEAATGLEVPEVASLPRGVEGEPTYRVGDQISATFTFSAEEAERTAAETGETVPPLPPELDGAQVRLVAGPALAQVWSSQSGGPPALVVGRAAAPTAFSDGVPFETVRDHLLSLPGVSDDLAAQLRAIDADGSTLPLPVPESRIGSTTTAQVDGNTATVLATRDQALAAVVWVDEGILTAVAGSLDTDEVLTVARGLG